MADLLGESLSAEPFELLHIAIWVPLSVNSLHHHKYFLIVLDNYSSFTCEIMLNGKYEVQYKLEFRNFISLVEN